MTDEIEIQNKAIAALIKPIEKFLGKILDPALMQAGELFADKVKFWRLKNQVEIFLKMEELLNKKGISPKRIPFKLINPILEAGSIEEDEFLKDKWASLLANAANPKYKSDIRVKYVEILKELSPTEAKFLDIIFDEFVNVHLKSHQSLYLKRTEPNFLSDYLKISDLEYYIMADNLIRLNLCNSEPTTSMTIYNIKNSIIRFFIPKIGPVRLNGKRIYQLTILGMDFVRSCKFDYGSKLDKEEKDWKDKVYYHLEELSKLIKRGKHLIGLNYKANEFREFQYDVNSILSEIVEKYSDYNLFEFEYIRFKKIGFYVSLKRDSKYEDHFYERGLLKIEDILFKVRKKLDDLVGRNYRMNV